MPSRFEAPIVTCPASVLHTAPQTIALPFNGGLVRKIGIVIPAGHSGVTGIALGFGNQPIMPLTVGTFYSGDDDDLKFDYTDNNPGVSWQAFVYNEDLQPHSWQVRFDLDEVADRAPPIVVSPIAPADIVAAGNSALAGA